MWVMSTSNRITFNKCSVNVNHNLSLQFASNPPWIPTRCITTCSCQTEVVRPRWGLKTSTRLIIPSASASGGRSCAGSRWEAAPTTGRWNGAARRSAELSAFHTPKHPVKTPIKMHFVIMCIIMWFYFSPTMQITIGVAYKQMERKSSDNRSRLGHNDQSWSLYWSGSGFSFWHGNREKLLSMPKARRIGVFLDQHAGLLSFYRVTRNTADLIYHHQHQFSGPLYAGFRFWAGTGAAVTICQLDWCEHKKWWWGSVKAQFESKTEQEKNHNHNGNHGGVENDLECSTCLSSLMWYDYEICLKINKQFVQLLFWTRLHFIFFI